MTKNNIIEIPSDDDIDFPFAPPIRGLPWKPPKDFVPNSDGEWMTKNNTVFPRKSARGAHLIFEEHSGQLPIISTISLNIRVSKHGVLEIWSGYFKSSVP